MLLEIPFGQDHQMLDIEDSKIAGIYQANPVKQSRHPDALKKALETPINSKPLRSFIAESRSILVVVNDATRPTPTHKVLDHLLPMLNDKPFRIIIATGSHRAPTDAEMAFIFGPHYQSLNQSGKIMVHDAKSDEQMVFIGVTRNQTNLWINRNVVDSDGIIIISSVEPHYFAGYTGGRKSIIPGLASYDTITQNHQHALDLNAQALKLDGNPVHDDMVDALKILKDKPLFSIQLVLDSNHQIYDAFAGHITASMDAAVAAAEKVFSIGIPQKENIVVSVAPYPMDIDLYQSQKAIDNGKLALNENGILIFVSQCRTGIGQDNFYRLMAGSSNAAEILKKIRQEYQLGYHKASKLVEIGMWAHLWAVTGLPDTVLTHIRIRPFSLIQDAVDSALDCAPKDSKILFFMQGSLTVPRIIA